MKTKVRIPLTFVMVIISAAYGLLIAADALTGIAVALGYVCLCMTIFVYNEYWRHHDR
jgi:hypothetical protein